MSVTPERARSGAAERVRGLMRSDTGRAGGMAAAVIAGNVIALVLTVVFARLLHAKGYGTFTALMSTYVILMVPGTALQTTVAREVSTEIAQGVPHPGAQARTWLRHLAFVTVALTVVSILARGPIASLIGVNEAPWAAAAALPSGCLWLMASVQRGALQGFQRYRTVGVSIVVEQVARLVIGVVLVLAGLHVTGAYLGTPLGLLAIVLALFVPLYGQIGPPVTPTAAHRLQDLVARAWAPVLALGLIAWLQDGHNIIVKHIATSKEAGSWGAANTAAKAIIWVAIGVSLYLVPETARRARLGEDARPILGRTLALIGILAVPAVLIFVVAAHPLLKAVFKLTGAAGALPSLGLAMTLLAGTYLAVQYKLALHRAHFIAVLGVAAVVQPLVILAIGPHLERIALGMLAVQAVLLGTMLLLAFLRRGEMGHDFEEDDMPELARALATPEA